MRQQFFALPNLVRVSVPPGGPFVTAPVVFSQEKCHKSERHGHGRWPLVGDLSGKQMGRGRQQIVPIERTHHRAKRSPCIHSKYSRCWGMSRA